MGGQGCLGASMQSCSGLTNGRGRAESMGYFTTSFAHHSQSLEFILDLVNWPNLPFGESFPLTVRFFNGKDNIWLCICSEIIF